MMGREQRELLTMLTALADEKRLAIVGLVAARPYNAGELARALDISESTVSHHIHKLRLAGLISLRALGTQRLVSLNKTRIARLKQLVNELEKLPAKPADRAEDRAWIDALGWDEADAAVLRKHLEGGRMLRIPTRVKEQLVLLRWLATKFQPGVYYTEKEVNALLTEAHEDYARLRRDLVDFGYMRRERGGGRYWLTPEEETIAPPST